MKKPREFQHFPGCKRQDPANCSGCALTDLRQDKPNYSAWPLAYMENEIIIPAKWKQAFLDELKSENRHYAANLRKHVREYGAAFSDGTFTRFINDEDVEIKGIV